MTEDQVLTDDERDRLINELLELGIKCKPTEIIKIQRLSTGKIVFLERGKTGVRGSGLKHILERHQKDFYCQGIVSNEIPELLITAILQDKIIGYQGTGEKAREIYEVIFKNEIYHIAITIAKNGYIVGANPSSYR
jgi:hypothetical protein